MTDYRPSTDEERATELALRNSIALAAYYNGICQRRPQDRAASVAEWRRKLDVMFWQGGIRRRRRNHTPINTPPDAAA